MKKNVLDVVQYGARGDGKTKNTTCIQKAIDECSNSGGGAVYFPPGDYLSGTLYLKNNVTLHLEAGATLWGSTEQKDYDTDVNCLLYAKNAENIGLVGKGRINGNGNSFWTPEREQNKQNRYIPKESRPRALIYLVACRGIVVKDVTFADSPFFTLWLLGCETAYIDRVTILNDRAGPNTDGIDIDCSSNVHVSNCHIVAGDDCICLKSDVTRLGYKHPCENITVTNCTLSTCCCGIRVGYEGDDVIRNCTFSNLVIYNTDIAIDIVVIVHPEVGIREGATVENISFSNMVIDADKPFFFWLGKNNDKVPKGAIRNILISNVIARANDGSFIGGIPENPLKNIRFHNVKLYVCGAIQPEKIIDVPWVWGHGNLPNGFYFKHVDGIVLRDVEVEWEDVNNQWEHALKFEHIKDLEMNGCKGRQGNAESTIPAVLLADVDRAFIHGCRALTGTGIFLELTGKSTGNVTVAGNDFSEARKAFRLESNVQKKNFSQISNRLPLSK